MAFAPLVPKNGAFSNTGFLADYAAFEITGQQSVEGVTPYGSNTCSVNVGSGTPDFTFNISAFAGAHATGSAAGLGSVSGAAPGAFSSGGVATTFTLDTGVTEACGMINSEVKISHARMRGAVPYNITGKNAGELVEVWALT